MPIKARTDMLTTGVRPRWALKSDLKQIEEIGKHIEMVAQAVPGTRSVYAERVSGAISWILTSGATRSRATGSP